MTFGDNGNNACGSYNPFTKELIDLSKHKYLYIDYSVPVRTHYSDYPSFMKICFDNSTGTDTSSKTSHDYDLGYIVDGRGTIGRKTKKFEIKDYDRSLSFSFSGWCAPDILYLEVRVYNIYLSNVYKNL